LVVIALNNLFPFTERMMYMRFATLSCGVLALGAGLCTNLEAGQIRIHMYSLPAKGVIPRTDIPIAVTAFRTQSSTETSPLVLGGGLLDVKPSNADSDGFVRSGTAIFDIPDSLYKQDDGKFRDNTPISFQFAIQGIVTQTVLAAVVPRSGSGVDLHIVVPDPTPGMEPCGNGPCPHRSCCSANSQSGATATHSSRIVAGKYVSVLATTSQLMVNDKVLGVVNKGAILPVRSVKDGWVWTSKGDGSGEVKGWIWGGDVEGVDAVVQFKPVGRLDGKSGPAVAAEK
jgi:hypothetical protein